MNNFNYYTPTQVVFGKDTEKEVGTLISEQGGKKVLVHFGGKSAVKCGLIDRVTAALDEKGIKHVSLGGVVPNPRVSLVREGIALCKKEGVDFILAVGGGSVIDSSKAIAYGLRYDGDVWDFYDRKAVPKASAPVGCVLTISAAGSEMSNSSVITNDEGGIKRGIGNDLCRLKFAVMNPELTYSVPPYQIASGCVDIIMHTLERWFNSTKTELAMTDAIAVAVMKIIIDNAPILMTDPKNYQAASEVMWASSLSHNGLTNCGSGPFTMAAHQLEHELSGMFDVAHGAGLSAIWASWARYVYKELPTRFAELGRDLFGVTYDAKGGTGAAEKAAVECIDRFEAFFKSLDMPIRISGFDIDVTDEQIKELAWKCSFEGTRKIASFKTLDVPDLEAIYRLARK
jgi:alcohol dehydrogenase YqhD (iron-dependent ADH family)